ncbi:MAG: cation transporter [Coriobacteriales bacterium]|jgi:copper ion binding protein|nr:cation transporter [Coriobacteriales bacterium]
MAAKTEVRIEGMHCAHCTSAVEGEIGRIPGVQKVKADLKKGTAIIKHDGSVALEALRHAVEEAGFAVV